MSFELLNIVRRKSIQALAISLSVIITGLALADELDEAFESPKLRGFDPERGPLFGGNDNELRLIAWNLAGFNSIPDSRFYTLIDAIVALDPDVLALVEVNYSYVAPALAYELSEDGDCYKRKLIRQSARQSIAIIHRCAVTVANPELIPGSNLNRTGLRSALRVDVSADEFDFALITVHQKAGRSSGDREDRTNQNEIVAAYVKDEILAATDEEDILIVGDYNMIPGDDDDNFDALNPDGHLRFISTDLALAGGFSHIRSGGQPGNFLDGYAIGDSATAEYIDDSIEVVQLHDDMGISLTDFRNDVSDHLPLLAVFSTDDADDD
jgi:exonuclease III